MLWFKRHTLPATVPEASQTGQTVANLAAMVSALGGRVDVVESREATRAAEHAAMVDQLDRLYKRISARIARGDSAPTGTDGESVLALKNRLKR